MYEKLKDLPEEIDLDSCYFYHTMELPGYGTIEGHWDLRGSEDVYLGPAEFDGRPAFDVGPGTGYLSFEMARRGARVIALEWDERAQSDFGLIPYSDYESHFKVSYPQKIDERRANILALRNSFLLAQRALRTEIPIYTGDVVRTAPPLEADVAFLGCILLHLRDPVGAIYNIARGVREAIVITDLTCDMPTSFDGPPAALFLPSKTDGGNVGTWWYLSPAALRQILTVVGFNRFELSVGSIFSNQEKRNAEIFNITAWRQ